MKLSNDGAVFTLTMSGVGAFNADSLAAFNEALDAVLADEQAEVLVITGEDKSFSQGLDLEFLMAVGAENPDNAMAFTRSCLDMIGRLLSFPLPVVSAINGHAFGLGAMIVLASDYCVMREDRGYFCLPEADLGMTLTERMNALVCGKLSADLLRDVLLTARRIGGVEAAERGIVDHACALEDLVAAGIELAAPMRGKKRESLAGLKRGAHSGILTVIEADVPDATIS